MDPAALGDAASEAFTPLFAAASTGTRLAVVGGSGAILTSECSPGCSPPSITSPFYLEATVQAGQAATMSLTAGGTPPLSYQWYEGLSGDTSTPVGSDASIFVTPPLSTATRYWVHVSNACGHMDSATVTVTVVEREIRRRLTRP